MTGVLNEAAASSTTLNVSPQCTWSNHLLRDPRRHLYFLSVDFPIVPINLTPVSALAVAVPSFFLTFEPNFQRVTGQFMQKVMTLAAPAAIAVVIYTMILTWMESSFNLSFETTSTLVVLLIAAVSFNVLLLVSQPFNRYKLGMLTIVFSHSSSSSSSLATSSRSSIYGNGIWHSSICQCSSRHYPSTSSYKSSWASAS